MGHPGSGPDWAAWIDLLAKKEIRCIASYGVLRILVPHTPERLTLRVECKAVLLPQEYQLLHHNPVAWSTDGVCYCCPVPVDQYLGSQAAGH